MIHYTTHQAFLRYAKPGCTVIELGDQLMDIGEQDRYIRSDKFYKEFKIVSIDWHGKNGAIKLDLSTPITMEPADIVTDFGTIEHVSNLEQALDNVDSFCKPGGIMIHSNPKKGTFPGHGLHWFDFDFWKMVAEKYSYEILELSEHHPYSEDNPDMEIFVVFKKPSK